MVGLLIVLEEVSVLVEVVALPFVLVVEVEELLFVLEEVVEVVYFLLEVLLVVVEVCYFLLEVDLVEVFFLGLEEVLLCLVEEVGVLLEGVEA